MTEIIFWVEDDPEGGYVARALGESIFTQADSIQELRQLVKDAVHCHYPDEATRPKLIRYYHYQCYLAYNTTNVTNHSTK